ncbi:CDP-alcohol phosphatidyltransferase family protein [Pseudomonas massiliensis]|uniref:CDP-alcohol phosphatidyltransferase family protein n=1 Tax=Pseudomonas massiliensis TaxID=522492 RepID=UPI000693A027|nr:CDP-alcohol phosphatidyltransferase family protein [Pseudomonas massiliensis]
MSDNRRPIQARSTRWAATITARLVERDITPNQISTASVGFAGLGALALLADTGFWSSLVCILAIQLRLLCNLFDGMVAIEGGRQSALGSLYNEFPDRLADSLLIVSLGYACGLPALGWFAALAAALTAYVRVFGGSIGLPQRFSGPMAKQHRMAVMTGSLALNALESLLFGTHHCLAVGLWIIGIGSAITCVTRSLRLARDIQASHPTEPAQTLYSQPEGGAHVDQ